MPGHESTWGKAGGGTLHPHARIHQRSPPHRPAIDRNIWDLKINYMAVKNPNQFHLPPNTTEL